MEVTVLDRQNIFDIALQEYGKVEAVKTLLSDNGLTFDSFLHPGQVLKVRAFTPELGDKIIYDNYKKEGREVATVNEELELDALPKGWLKIDGGYLLVDGGGRVFVD